MISLREAGTAMLAGAALVSASLDVRADLERPEEHALSESLIRNDLIGKTLKGRYRNGNTWRESYGGDRKIVYLDKDSYWTGKWSFRYTAFCTFYDKGNGGACWHVVKVSDNCYQFYVAQPTGRPLGATPGKPRPWTAEGWRTDRPSTCSPLVGT